MRIEWINGNQRELNEEPAVVVCETSLAPQHQLMSNRGILSLKPDFDLNGEAKTTATKRA
jgi:hypothetical protein